MGKVTECPAVGTAGVHSTGFYNGQGCQWCGQQCECDEIDEGHCTRCGAEDNHGEEEEPTR